ncbi:MAG: CASC3 protein CASC3 [Denitrobacterium sp.]|jgi:ABC-type Fe3+ transport system permease subunit|nr:CASC3 protein CASC3 [Denitrobacterium sp.]MCI1480476.1 CASC3 protein CASC3 [Eggerthellaceae bacterium]
MANKKMTAKQREARLEEARKREEAAKRKKERAERMKRIGIVIVCVILVLALGVPTVALSFLSTGA